MPKPERYIKDKSNYDLVKISCTSVKKTIFYWKKFYLFRLSSDHNYWWSLAVTDKLINHLLIL